MPVFAFLAGLVAAGALASPAGPRPFTIVSPDAGAEVGLDGVEIILRFDPQDPGVGATFRALLNGADVTAAFTTASNGAYARLHDLLDGENVLRVETFGRCWWPRRVFAEHAQELHFHLRRPLDLDRG